MDKYEKLAEIGKGNENMILRTSNILILFLLLMVGSFGYVFKIKRKSDGKILCWKELDYGRMQEREK